MSTKSIKISEDNYRWLNELVGRIRIEEGRAASIDDALSALKKEKKKSIREFAGAWSDVSDKEIRAMKKSMKEMWKRWKM